MKEDSLSQDQVRKRAARGAMTVFTRHALVRLMAFAGTLLLARLIDPHTFGVFALAQFLLLLANAIAVGGITTALTRRHEAVTPLEYRTAHALQLMLGAAIFIVVAALTPVLAAAYDLTGSEAWAFVAMSLALFLLASRSIPTAVLQRSLRHDLVAVSEVAEYVTYAIASIGLAFAGWGLWALVAGTLLRYLVATLFLYRVARSLPAIAFDRAIASRIMRETLPMQTTILLGLMQRGINTTVVAAVLSPAAAGLVGMATTLLDSLVLQPLTLLSNIQFRLLARVQHDPEQFRRVLAQSYFLASVVCLPVLVASILLFPLLVGILFPPSWADTGYLVQVLSAASLTQLVSMPTLQALKAIGDLRPIMLAYVLSALAQLAILLVVGKAGGLQGFAIANITGYTVIMLFGLYRIRVRTGRAAPIGPVIGVAVAGGVAAAAGLGVATALPVEWRLLGAVAGALVYPLALLLTSGRRVAAHLRLIGEASSLRLPIARHAAMVLAGLADWCGGLLGSALPVLKR